MSKIEFTSDKRETFNGWNRSVNVDGVEFCVSVQRGKSVRIPFKPRGKNRGWHWNGAVYRMGPGGGYVWTGRVPGTIGVRGLLIEADIIEGAKYDL